MILFITAALLAGCATTSAPTYVPSAAHTVEAVVPVWVLDDGWHTGLILSIRELGKPLSDLRHWLPHARYVVFGWGNRRYYMAAHPGLGTALPALFPSPSVLYVEGLAQRNQAKFRHGIRLHRVCLRHAGLKRLQAYLAASFTRGPHGHVRSILRGPAPESWFFASAGTYDAFHTSNTWTAEALRISGVPIHARGVLFAGQVISELNGLDESAAQRPCD